MTDYLILHHKEPTFRLNEDHKLDGGYLVSMRDYLPIATVSAGSLGEAFELTNHVDHCWTKNDGITLFNRELADKVRSTGVGDLVLNLETLTLMICGPVGWERAEWVS